MVLRFGLIGMTLNLALCWKEAIREAIQKGAFFMACFSKEYNSKSETHMNEELTIAIERLRKIHTDREWFIPVLISECDVPDRSIGGGEMLHDIQWVQLYEDWKGGIQSILSVILKREALGFGTIGQKLAGWLLQNGATVWVYEPSQEKALLAQQKGGIRYTGSATSAATNKNFVIGASGRRSVDSTVISKLSHNTYLVSASSAQYEIDLDELSQLAIRQEQLADDNDNIIGTDFILPPDNRYSILYSGADVTLYIICRF